LAALLLVARPDGPALGLSRAAERDHRLTELSGAQDVPIAACARFGRSEHTLLLKGATTLHVRIDVGGGNSVAFPPR
jgi:hypothetical protein